MRIVAPHIEFAGASLISLTLVGFFEILSHIDQTRHPFLFGCQGCAVKSDVGMNECED